jgi:hypothetical protein
MKYSVPWQADGFYSACLEGDFNKARACFIYSSLNRPDNDGNTPLHIVSSKGYTELLELLFRYHADQTLKNNAGLTAEQMAKDDQIKNLFKTQMKPKADTEHLVGSVSDVEWVDNYKNAYRIAYENLEHMKRWLLKVPLKKLLNEMKIGYIDKMKLSYKKSEDDLQNYLKPAFDNQDLVALIKAYSSGGTGFCTKLNYDLAEIGSNFRFLSTQNLFNSGYLDNEPPKGLGQHIFAAILINHPYFQSYYYTGDPTHRGMKITPEDLAQYKVDSIVLTRSFLSTSKAKNVAEVFKGDAGPLTVDADGKLPVQCVYKVINPRSSLNIETISVFPEEEEVLILPFVVFRITAVDMNSPITIYLEEFDSNKL